MNLPGYVRPPPSYEAIENLADDVDTTDLAPSMMIRSNVSNIVLPMPERNIPIAMDELQHASLVFIELNDFCNIGREGQTKYSIKNSRGNQIYYTLEPPREKGFWELFTCSSKNWATIILDNFHRPICKIKRQGKSNVWIIKSPVDVHSMTIVRNYVDVPNSGLIGLDATGQRVFRIDGQSWHGRSVFKVVNSVTGEQLATIDKTFGKLFMELTTDGDVYKITFQTSPSEALKASIIATALIIDAIFYVKFRI